MMIGIVAGTWLLLAILTTLACAAVARGGAREDTARGYLDDRVEPPLQLETASR